MKFDSPFEKCPVCDKYVLLDQTQRECAVEHECGDRKCPLGRFFEGHEFGEKHETPSGDEASEKKNTVPRPDKLDDLI